MKVATATGIEPARRQPTLQDMLRHTAGRQLRQPRRHAAPQAAIRAGCGARTASRAPSSCRSWASCRCTTSPGSTWDYSYGLDVAGLAVEAVTKKRLGEFLQERLFTPLGMVDTGFVVPASKAARIAKPLAIDPEPAGPRPSARR